jgi:hypothetical protein
MLIPDQAKKVRGLSGSSMCYFTQVQFPETTGYVDLRPWMDSTPITLSHGSSMQVAFQLFEKLVDAKAYFVDFRVYVTYY